jgi:hypothetical protein
LECSSIENIEKPNFFQRGKSKFKNAQGGKDFKISASGKHGQRQKVKVNKVMIDIVNTQSIKSRDVGNPILSVDRRLRSGKTVPVDRVLE